jgi:cellobiose-specific phosphotransferase system component IIC
MESGEKRCIIFVLIYNGRKSFSLLQLASYRFSLSHSISIRLTHNLSLALSSSLSHTLSLSHSISLLFYLILLLRKYTNGSVLRMHVDTINTHVVSAIINVDQQLDDEVRDY